MKDEPEKECSNCNNKFRVSWWSNRSRIEAMKIEICPACEIELHPNGVLAQWLAANANCDDMPFSGLQPNEDEG